MGERKTPAGCMSGVLDIDVPIAQASKPRQIQIQTGEAREGDRLFRNTPHNGRDGPK